LIRISGFLGSLILLSFSRVFFGPFFLGGPRETFLLLLSVLALQPLGCVDTYRGLYASKRFWLSLHFGQVWSSEHGVVRWSRETEVVLTRPSRGTRELSFRLFFFQPLD